MKLFNFLSNLFKKKLEVIDTDIWCSCADRISIRKNELGEYTCFLDEKPFLWDIPGEVCLAKKIYYSLDVAEKAGQKAIKILYDIKIKQKEAYKANLWKKVS